MFVLQDCSICFEDYGAQRIPHSISCGHVFCRPCLDSLVSSSPNCPNCRASIGRKTIRKVVCTLQDPPALDASTLLEAEMIMWQAIESAAESVDGFEQRRSLVRDNSKLAARKAGFSRNVLIALDAMRLLVEVESTNRGVDDNMESARAIEESLRDQISFLEAQLNGTRASFSTNIRDFQTLLSRMQQLESSIWTPNDITPQTIPQPTTANPLPALTNPHTSPLVSISTASNQEQIPSRPESKSTPPSNTSLAGSQSPRVSVLAATPAESVKPSLLNAAALPFSPHAPRLRNPPVFGSASISFGSMDAGPSLAPSQPKPPNTWANVVAANSSRWGRVVDQRSTPSSSHISPAVYLSPPTASTRVPTQRIVLATFNYIAECPVELSLTAGEIVQLAHGPDSLGDDVDYVWCYARGEEGLVPKRCLAVADVM